MHLRTGLLAAAVACVVPFAAAQDAASSDDRLNRLEQRMNDMERQLKERDAEIARLKQELQSRPTTPATSSASDIEKTKQDILSDLDSRKTQPVDLRNPGSFNPNIAVIGNFVGNVSTQNENPARNRWDIGSVELDFRAAVAPVADAVVILPLEREVESELFFLEPEEEGGEVESGIDIEEAYLTFHDFGVKNLTAKLGRFHLRFGRQNILHAHNWATADNAFVVKSFLAEEALTDNGLSLSYVLPPEWLGGQYVEVVGEIITGEGGETSPVMNNDANIDSPSLNLHALWNTNLADDLNFELGGSFLATKHELDQDAYLYGIDATLTRTDPTGGFMNTLVMAEVIAGDVDTEDGNQNGWGLYVLGQQQLTRDVYVGARFDWTQNALDEDQEVWGVSPYITWYYFEFLRFRLEYQHKDGDVASEDTLYFQCTFTFGSHPPHPYWAMK